MDLARVSLLELVRRLATGRAPDGSRRSDPALHGVGWATVDLERTVGGITDVLFGESGGEPALGARALRAKVGSIDLVLLEPSTEGRLAGWLARNGEGVAVLYVDSAVPGSTPGRATAVGRPGRLEAPTTDRARPFVMTLDAE